MQRTIQWFTPAMSLLASIGVSMITGLIAFQSSEFARETTVTFFAYYVILVFMTLMFVYREKLLDKKTRQLLQFSFFLLGFVLMVTGFLGVLNGNLGLKTVFLLMLFFPGLAMLRAGLHFNKRESQ